MKVSSLTSFQTGVFVFTGLFWSRRILSIFSREMKAAEKQTTFQNFLLSVGSGLFLLAIMLSPVKAFGATLSLSPASGTYEIGQDVKVDILLNTENTPIDGVDIHYLNFDPTLVEIKDQDPGATGVQIAPGHLMPRTLANSVDSAKGQVTFSQITNGGTKFTNNEPQVLATVTMRVLKSAPINLTLTFKPGETRDSNVAALAGRDMLSSVFNSHFEVLPKETGSGQALLIVLILVIAVVAILTLVKFTKKRG